MTNQLQTTTTGPDIFTAIERADLATTTKAQYSKAIRNAQAAGVNLSDPAKLRNDALADYAAGLKTSSRAFLKSAISLWLNHAIDQAKDCADPTADIKELFETNQRIQSSIYKSDSLQKAIAIKQPKGSKTHAWLSQAEVKQILLTCDTTTLIGKRDRIVLGLLFGAGLRREELAQLDFKAIERLPGRVVLNVTGKGAKDRTVPLRDTLAAALDEWQEITGPGKIARSVTKGGTLGGDISAVGIFKIINRAGHAIGKPKLAPHDARRTFAQLGYEAGVPLTQISLLLGHSSLDTTKRYLNLELDLKSTVSDFIPFA